MKKRIVFFGYNMEIGGAERALVNVIKFLHKYFIIDLVLIEKKGILLNDIPKDVNIKAIKNNLFQYCLFRFIPFFRKKIINNLTKKYKYEFAVAFMEGRAATWTTDMKQSCPKIAWIHNDVSMFDIGISKKEIINTYNKIDKIVIVSKESQKSFCKKYNISEDKTEVIYNLIDEKEIIKLSKEQTIKKDKFTFVNVARMRPQKRQDRLLHAIKKLSDEGFNFDIWIIGDGILEKELKSLSKELKIEVCVHFLGLLENPFPYVKAADYFVMSSDHEGYPLTLLESLLLKTPVISTDVSGAEEILQNKYGIICNRSLEGLTDAMRNVLVNSNNKLKNNLEKYKGPNNEIKNQLKKLFGLI